MEEQQEKTAKYYINKYKMIKCFDLSTGEITYQRELRGKTKNIQLILAINTDNHNICSLAKFAFNKRTGDFKDPKFIENIKNDIEEITK